MPPGGEGNSERGVPLPLRPLPTPERPSLLNSRSQRQFPEASAGAEGRDRQTPILARAGSFKQLGERGGCSESRGRFPELSRGLREEGGGQGGLGTGETGCGGSGAARHPTCAVCCGMRSGSRG